MLPFCVEKKSGLFSVNGDDSTLADCDLKCEVCSNTSSSCDECTKGYNRV